MSTFMAKAETVERKWYVLDAAGKPLGRTAATAAMLLRGKHKATLPLMLIAVISLSSSTSQGCSDRQEARAGSCIVVTAGLVTYKEVQYKTLVAENPEKAMQLAVKGMLPKNSIGRQSATRLKIYKGAEHGHAAQKPEASGKVTISKEDNEECIHLRKHISTVPAEESPLLREFVCSQAAPAKSKSTTVPLITTLVWRP